VRKKSRLTGVDYPLFVVGVILVQETRVTIVGSRRVT
jgi:predicted Rossmann fold nucleotide-binding protein DprA/Smf involved in DNA uptake